LPRTLAELFREIARQASEFESPVLAHLCRMAALEAAHSKIALDWDWYATGNTATPAPGSPEQVMGNSSPSNSKPYQVWSKKGTGSYTVLVPNAKAALATASELSGRGHLEIVVKDMDGNVVDPEVLQVIVDLEANPTIRLLVR
jgi:hypothetical protein